MDPIRIAIGATPRTKKTSNRVLFVGPRCRACNRGKLPLVKPSEAYEEFAARAVPALRLAWSRAPLAQPVRVAAVFYREALRGDLVGFMQALADVLQAAGVLVDDKWIVSWDGTRLDKDAARPRVELVLTAIDQVQPQLPLAAAGG